MKKIQFLSIALALSVLTAVSCNKKAEEATTEPTKTEFDLAAAKTALQTNYADFEKAFNAKDSVGLANCYTADAKFMGPNEKAVEGRPAIQKTFSMWMKGDMPTIKMNLVDAWGNENSLTAENAWTLTAKDGKVVDQGKSIEVYKMEDGKWKLFRDCYNSDMPIMPAK